MEYALMLTPHPNVRYRESLKQLAQAELAVLLGTLSVEADIRLETLGGAAFLCFEVPELEEQGWRQLSRLSGVCLWAERQGERLRPLAPIRDATCLGEDLPALLKYKGKTNESFTTLLLNLALWSSEHWWQEQLVVLDPMCGRGTGPMTALLRGWNAVGLEIDKRDVKECNDFFTRYLEYHRIKHQKKQLSCTVRGKQAALETSYAFAVDAVALKERPQCFRLLSGDTVQTADLLKAKSVHLLLCDLPYGVQHGPDIKHKGGLAELLARSLPGWYAVLKPGGAMALSFNSYTLKRQELARLAENAGFTVISEGAYLSMEHWVEQAVNRDVLVAK